jgi:uncharacterized C2H2 Zn-finger protein
MLDSMVKIHNRNQYDYTEKFKGREIFVPAGSFIEMDYEEGNRFLGQMPEFKRLKDGTQDPRSFKWLEMDKDDRRRVELALRNESEDKAKKIFVCHACKKEFDDKKDLLKHVKKEHMNQLEEKAREELE